MLKLLLVSVVSTLLFVGCSSNLVDGGGENQVEFIELSRTDQGIQIGKTVVTKNEFSKLPDVLSKFRSKKVLLTRDNSIDMLTLLEIGPILSKAGYEMFSRDATGKIKQVFHVDVE